MVNPGFEGADAEHLRAMFEREADRYVVIPNAIDEAAAAALRDRLEREPMTAFYIADRGRYRINIEHVDDAAFDELRGLAERVTGSRLVRRAAAWWRFARGDYQLTHGDALARHPGRHLELVVDFSALATEQAELVYTHGGNAFTIPQWPTAVALVERGEHLHRFVRYLNHRVGDAVVWRLCMTFEVA